MSINKVRVSAERFNKILNGFKYYVDFIRESGDSTIQDTADTVEKMFDALLRYGSVGEYDFDSSTGNVDMVTMRYTNRELGWIARLDDWIYEAESEGYDKDYTGVLANRYRAYIADRDRRAQEVRDGWARYQSEHEKPTKSAFAKEFGYKYHFVLSAIRGEV